MLLRVIIRRWFWLYLILAIDIIAIYSIDYSTPVASEQLIESKIALISGISATTVTFITILGIFIAFTYDQKLMNASKTLRQIYRPYGIQVESWRLNLVNYEKFLSEDIILRYCYPLLLIVSCFTIMVWGFAVGFYTKFVNPFGNIKLLNLWPLQIQGLSFTDSINLGIYALWLILIAVFVSVTIAVNLVRLNKDALGKGFLPISKLICDVDFLRLQDADLDEIFIKNGPILLFYKNPPANKPKYELKLELPVKLLNYRFVIKIYLADGNTILKCYGVLKVLKNIGERYCITVCNNLSEEVYLKIFNQETFGEMKVFGPDLLVISRLSLAKEVFHSGCNSFRFVPERIIEHRDSRELEGNLLINKNTESIEIEIENIVS